MSYRNTVYCGSVVRQHADGRLTSRYCGARWCFVCNRVRTARAIIRYSEGLSGWKDPQFVTLTIPNVSGAELKAAIDEMIAAMPRICLAIRRTDKLAVRLLRKLECTYSHRFDNFHPHFHLVVEGTEVAERIVARWLANYPAANRAAQNIRPCDEFQLRELFKYFTKLTTQLSGTNRAPIPAEALDTIFRAMRRKRVYQPMGFKAIPLLGNDEEGHVGDDAVNLAWKRQGELVQWEWSQRFHDWLDYSTGEILTDFVPPARLTNGQTREQHPRG